MTARAAIAAGCLGAMTLLASPDARAEQLIASMSNHRVTITPNYTGEELVLFGSIERDARTPANRSYDLVVTVSGPSATVVTWRKDRLLGVWINRESRVFDNVPSYLAVFANRPLTVIANAETLRRQRIGIANVPALQAQEAADDPFRAAFLRLKGERGLYRESANSVTFLTPTLFRTSIPLPADVPVGTYTVDIKAFAGGGVVTRAETAIEIVKIGFEQFVAEAARQHGAAYGLITTLFALMTGWFASVVFRRD
ncbi:MAG: TIGR02186 family protein [Xanthobacteraceae bacterium]|nr:MAG: TIGR02186 family protein [Xanthobacteraceae bacterium]